MRARPWGWARCRATSASRSRWWSRWRTRHRGIMRLARAGLAVGLAVALIAAVVLARAVLMRPRQVPVTPADAFAVDQAAAERLAGAVRIPTVSTEAPSEWPDEEFTALHAYLVRAFPATHSALRRETVGRDALLYTWPGTDA